MKFSLTCHIFLTSVLKLPKSLCQNCYFWFFFLFIIFITSRTPLEISLRALWAILVNNVSIFSAPEPKAHYCDHALSGIQRNLTGSSISISSTKFLFFVPIGKTRWPPWPLIGWDIFYFSSETPERNSRKLDKKQDLNVLYQVCVFQADE